MDPQRLAPLAARAAALEDTLRSVRCVLDAIAHGGLLDALPGDNDGDQCRHNAATGLLDLLRQKIGRVEDLPGVDLSIALHTLAKNT